MPESEPFVIYEADCQVETSALHANPDVRWWTLVSADRRASDTLTVGLAEIDSGEHPEMRLLYVFGVSSFDAVEYHFAEPS